MKTKFNRSMKYLFESSIILLSVMYIVRYGGMYKENLFHIIVWNIFNILFWRELYRIVMQKAYDDENDGVFAVMIMFLNSTLAIFQIIISSIIICMISSWMNITLMSIVAVVFLWNVIKIKIIINLSDR